MMKKENMWKLVVSGALVLTVVATGVTLYGSGEDKKEDNLSKQDMELVDNSSDEEKDDPLESKDTSGDSVVAENYGDINKNDVEVPNVLDNSENNVLKPTEITPNPETPVDESKDTSAEVLPVLNFSEDSVMAWPVSGEVLIDYSMDTTTYFETLNQYKCSDGLVLGSEVGTAVQAAANGEVISILENEETGVTVTMNLGNGYQAIYGQLKDVKVDAGDKLEKGVILGYVDEPTKYFVKEGSNLYFSMKKDGVNVDPMIYLETVTE